MSTTEVRDPEQGSAAPRARFGGPVLAIGRRGWRRLTSMRTALILLFLLAVAAVPGSLLPQAPIDPQKVTAYIKSHGAWGQFLNDIGMYDVFGSIWFAAIYLLLAVSLIGCLIPRIRVHARAVVRTPLPAPRNLDRLPESGRFETSVPVADYVAAARTTLGRRWRIAQRTEDSGAVTLSAEKGYSRETGNLIFHVALLVALVLIAVGRLYMYEGQVIVVQGPGGFCSAPSNFDTWTPGRFAAEGKVSPAPICVTDLRKFTATYSSDGEPLQFKADITYTPRPGAAARQTSIEVNHPLRVEGDRLYLQGHGYAPSVTLRMPGQKPQSATDPFLPSNASTLLSEGVFKFPSTTTGQDIGIRGIFAPSAVDQATGGPVTASSAVSSISPATTNPVLSIFVYKGNLAQDGQAVNVYALDTTQMRKIDSVNLRAGQTVRLPGGGTLTYNGWKPWVNFQVSHDPAQSYLLAAAAAMVLGLFGSLAIRRRRVWLRVAPGPSGPDGSPTVVGVGGLARSDSGNFTTEFAALLSRLAAAAPPVVEGLPESLPAGAGDTVGAGKDTHGRD